MGQKVQAYDVSASTRKGKVQELQRTRSDCGRRCSSLNRRLEEADESETKRQALVESISVFTRSRGRQYCRCKGRFKCGRYVPKRCSCSARRVYLHPARDTPSGVTRDRPSLMWQACCAERLHDSLTHIRQGVYTLYQPTALLTVVVFFASRPNAPILTLRG